MINHAILRENLFFQFQVKRESVGKENFLVSLNRQNFHRLSKDELN